MILLATFVLFSMSSLDIHSNLFSMLLAILSRKLETELLRALVFPEQPVAIGLVFPGSFLWSLYTTYMVDLFLDLLTLLSITLPCWPWFSPDLYIFAHATLWPFISFSISFIFLQLTFLSFPAWSIPILMYSSGVVAHSFPLLSVFIIRISFFFILSLKVFRPSCSSVDKFAFCSPSFVHLSFLYVL